MVPPGPRAGDGADDDLRNDDVRLLSLARDLGRRKARERQGLFVTEGVRATEELLRSPLAITGALVAPQLVEAPRGARLLDDLRARGVRVEEVSERDFASAAETDSPQGILAIGSIPTRALPVPTAAGPVRVLVLDALQDPGNVGTIVRTAAALGVHATVALPGTVDLWNAKVVRAAMGAQFHHDAFHCTGEELTTFLRTHEVALWGADAHGEPIGVTAAPTRLALVMGNEGNGLTAELRARLDHVVSIPITDRVESLNVAVATGILLHALRPQ